MQSTDGTPVAIFVFNRPVHTRRMLESLLANDGAADATYYVFSDGPRTPEQRRDVEAVRDIARTMLGSRASYVFRENNMGLAASIISGISYVLEHHDRVIVVEDDLVLERGFLRFIDHGLRFYANEPKMMHVSGFAFDVPGYRPPGPSILPVPSSWGWGTWRRAWQHFDARASGWRALQSDASLRRRFDLQGAIQYTEMLEDQMRGYSDSWAIRWYWSIFKLGGLSLYPPSSLVRNLGFDGSGTNSRWQAQRIVAFVEDDRGESLTLRRSLDIDVARLQAIVDHITRHSLIHRYPMLRYARKVLRLFRRLRNRRPQKP